MKPGPKTHWTHARIVGALQAFAAQRDRPPKLNEWLKATPFTPSVSTVRFQFGTWNLALEAAGLPVRTSRVYWTRDRLIAAAQAWAEAHGVPPAADDWGIPTSASPSYSTVYYHFGSWNALLVAAGLPTVTRRRWTRDRVAEAMLDHLGRTGSWPVDADWKVAANGVSRPTHGTVVKLFGSWRAAKRYAGWDGTRRRSVEADPVGARPLSCTGCGCGFDTYSIGCDHCKWRRAARAARARKQPSTVAAPHLVEPARAGSEIGVSGALEGAATPLANHNRGEAEAPAAQRRAA